MADKKQPPKRRDLSLRRGDNLDALAQVSASDLARIREQWRKDAPPGFADLLDAQPFEES